MTSPTHREALSYPFTYWVGMDTDPRTPPEQLDEFNRFYSTTHVGEVIAAHPGFVTSSRYELVDPDSMSGPRWLAIYGMRDEQAAQQYLKDNERPWLHRQKYSPWPRARRRARTVWRLLWRQVFPSGAASQAPESLLMVGTNEPAATDSSALTRLELYRAFAHPEPGCPRFVAVYAADSAPSGSPNAGPPAGQNHETVWRLAYRRIPLPE